MQRLNLIRWASTNLQYDVRWNTVGKKLIQLSPDNKEPATQKITVQDQGHISHIVFGENIWRNPKQEITRMNAKERSSAVPPSCYLKPHRAGLCSWRMSEAISPMNNSQSVKAMGWAGSKGYLRGWPRWTYSVCNKRANTPHNQLRETTHNTSSAFLNPWACSHSRFCFTCF